MLTDVVLFIARLTFIVLLLINLVYLLFPATSAAREKKLEYRIEHSLLAIAGAVGFAVLQWV